MPPILTWQSNNSADQLAQMLAAGKCVGLPTEATFEIVASGVHLADTSSMSRYASEEHPAAIILGDYANLTDWMP
ncbi:MAG: hypothetical protein HYR84_11385, partial [Planctomycetes bacterium]|nr:hypothetical protein [Planctomycetota bacterium]